MTKRHSPKPDVERLWSWRQNHLALHASPRGYSELKVAPIGVVSLPLAPPRVRTIGCLFEESREQVAASRDKDDVGRELFVSPSRPATPRYTRIRPPRDLVKLEDRLRLLLQPPLESLLAAQSLQFPFQPFGFQLDGVAFLF